MVDAQAQAQAQASAHDEAPGGGRLLLLQLGATNDASGTPDPDVLARCPVTVALYREAVAAGRPVTVLASGGEYSSSESSPFTFNPTATPHAEIVMAALLASGLPEAALVRPGLPAMHTVDEALLCRELLLSAQHGEGSATDAGVTAPSELVVVTSEYHAARAEHLFGPTRALT